MREQAGEQAQQQPLAAAGCKRGQRGGGTARRAARTCRLAQLDGPEEAGDGGRHKALRGRRVCLAVEDHGLAVEVSPVVPGLAPGRRRLGGCLEVGHDGGDAALAQLLRQAAPPQAQLEVHLGREHLAGGVLGQQHAAAAGRDASGAGGAGRAGGARRRQRRRRRAQLLRQVLHPRKRLLARPRGPQVLVPRIHRVWLLAAGRQRRQAARLGIGAYVAEQAHQRLLALADAPALAAQVCKLEPGGAVLVHVQHQAPHAARRGGAGGWAGGRPAGQQSGRMWGRAGAGVA